MTFWRGAAQALLSVALSGLLPGLPTAESRAAVLRYCDAPTPLDAAQQDRLLRFAALIKAELDGSGHTLALVARSGLDLSRFGQRYSHAGISLQGSANAPWSVRQLYFDCDERRPRLFDQGIAGFLLGAADPGIGYVSVLLLPAAAAVPLQRAALDKRLALSLLGTRYSANAHAFATRYQNCNQWVAELLAVAWGAPVGDDLPEGADQRAQAQRWLQAQGYAPTTFDLGNPLLLWLGDVVPWLHRDDHPPEDIASLRFRVSMPASIEAFTRASVPGAQRIEFCHNDRQVVIRRGWDAIAEGCRPGAQDRVVALD